MDTESSHKNLKNLAGIQKVVLAVLLAFLPSRRTCFHLKRKQFSKSNDIFLIQGRIFRYLVKVLWQEQNEVQAVFVIISGEVFQTPEG